jgi:hypothetical protein
MFDTLSHKPYPSFTLFYNLFYSQRGSLLGAQHFFKKYAKDLEKDDPCCPLCHRGFDTQQDVRELVLEVGLCPCLCLVKLNIS